MNRIQTIELNILKEIIDVLENNNLRYIASGGTIIGAVRHGGFIPWDDDIDISMPRIDYEKFRTHIYKKLPEHLKKVDCDNSKSNTFLFMKIYDDRTTYIGDYCKSFPDWYTGVFVDIFPMDGVPSDSAFREKYYNNMYKLEALNISRRHGVVTTESTGTFKKILKEIVNPVIMISRYNYFTDRIKKKALTIPYDSSEYVYTVVSYNNKIRSLLTFKRGWLSPIKHKFEDLEINIPCDFDSAMTVQYGNYMEMPPIEKRISHEIAFCDLDTPVNYYKQNGESIKWDNF